MKKFRAIPLIVSIPIVTLSLLSQTQKSAVGTWKFDPTRSDLGSEPAPKSLFIVVLKDTPQMLSWRVRGTDEKGKPFSYSWSGPEDGTMHPVTVTSGSKMKESAKKESDGTLVRHGEDSDGSSFDASSSLSEDGNTMTDQVTEKSKDGKETTTKYVYERVTHRKKS